MKREQEKMKQKAGGDFANDAVEKELQEKLAG